MTIYNYDEEGKYNDEGLADESPLEEGVFLIPAKATVIAPPIEKVGFERVFNGEWGYEIIIPPKPNEYSIWNGEIWEENSDLKIEFEEREYETLCNEVRAKRDRMIDDCSWRRNRSIDESAMGFEPTEPLSPILEYIQWLRDIPQQEGFPDTIEWPVAPWEAE